MLQVAVHWLCLNPGWRHTSSVRHLTSATSSVRQRHWSLFFSTYWRFTSQIIIIIIIKQVMWPVRVYCAIVGGVCFRPTVPRTSWSRCLVKPRAIAMRPSPGSSLFIHAHRPINGHHSLNRLVHSISRCQTNDKISRQNRWTMTHGRYCRLLLHTLSASTTAECRSQNNTCITWTKIITNTINN